MGANKAGAAGLRAARRGAGHAERGQGARRATVQGRRVAGTAGGCGGTTSRFNLGQGLALAGERAIMEENFVGEGRHR